MATTTTLTLGGLIDDTLEMLYRASERPFQVEVGSNALDSATDTQLTVSDASRVQQTDILEFGDEMCLVTGKSSDATPVVTVARGYAGTTASSGHATSTVALINPPWPRSSISSYVQRGINALLNSQLPSTTTESMTRTTDMQYIVMPELTMRVYSVRHLIGQTGRIIDVGGWQFEQDMPTGLISSGKALRLPTSVENNDSVIVMYQLPYAFDGSGETATIAVPLGAEDIPALWAAAYSVSRREISRMDVDKIEEWNQDAAMRQGVNLRWARELWGEVYRRVDEAKTMQNLPRNRPFRKTPHLL
jgi:hypothetical protein